ncbi:MAG: RsmB/NOP family class I SAM-dependent RNA methyltransferase, partial [Acidobacteriota bacterium]
CSGTGTLRKHPELKWRISPGEIGRLVRQAERMLDGSAAKVAAGGLLVAITCSLEPEENEQLIEKWLGRQEEFIPEPLEEHLHYPHDRSILGPGGWRLLTDGDHDGFTVHVLRRRGPRPA